MAPLLLDSLEIKGFRAFHDLRVEKLGRVNLIVGPNNVGKTCLLEALQIYAGRAHPRLLWQLLREHDEDRTGETLSTIQNLFYLWPEMNEPVPPISIGPIDELNKTLHLALGLYTANLHNNGQIVYEPLSSEERGNLSNAVPFLSVQLGADRPVVYPLGLTVILPESEIPLVNCALVDAHDFSAAKLGALWDAIASTDLQKEVINALRIIAPGISTLSITEELNAKQERFPLIEIPAREQAFPMRTFGEGMQRVLAIVLSLLNAQNGLLLIDEIEHGIFYLWQIELWDLIFRLARQLNIQVFATSHSWDCIVAFSNAIARVDRRKAQNDQQNSEDQETEAMLFRLRLKKDEASSVMYDKRKLSIAAQQTIEVR